jgi:hypothetical protein
VSVRASRPVARLKSAGLDARLGEGENPSSDPLLAARARKLQSPRERCRLAVALTRAQARAACQPGFSAAVPVDARAVQLAAPALAQLADALRRRESVNVRGVAIARLLLTESTSPLYRPSDPEALYEAARHALLALLTDADALR